MTPTTEAGRRLAKALAYLRDPGSYEPGDRYLEDVRAILAVEVEAREQERARIRAGLRDIEGHPHAESGGRPGRYWIDRAAVRALIDRSEP